MSRIGKKAVAIPSGVTVTLDGQTVTVKGPKGELSWTVAEEIEVAQANGELTLAKRVDGQRAQAMWGLSRTLVANMVTGVTTGFERTLELVKISGIDKQQVGETAARIRRIRPPEPYKGKGVRYAGEQVRRKEGKKK
jgi:large subunit ribosomal protein L6